MLEPELERYIAEHPYATSVGLYDTSDPARGLAVLQVAARTVSRWRREDEPFAEATAACWLIAR